MYICMYEQFNTNDITTIQIKISSVVEFINQTTREQKQKSELKIIHTDLLIVSKGNHGSYLHRVL